MQVHMTKAHILLIATLLILVSGTSIFAHHSTLLQITAVRVQIQGTIAKIEWTNPHVYIYIDVTDPADRSKTVSWAVETGSPKECTDKGLVLTNLKIGIVLEIKGA